MESWPSSQFHETQLAHSARDPIGRAYNRIATSICRQQQPMSSIIGVEIVGDAIMVTIRPRSAPYQTMYRPIYWPLVRLLPGKSLA